MYKDQDHNTLDNHDNIQHSSVRLDAPTAKEHGLQVVAAAAAFELRGAQRPHLLHHPQPQPRPILAHVRCTWHAAHSDNTM